MPEPLQFSDFKIGCIIIPIYVNNPNPLVVVDVNPNYNSIKVTGKTGQWSIFADSLNDYKIIYTPKQTLKKTVSVFTVWYEDGTYCATHAYKYTADAKAAMLNMKQVYPQNKYRFSTIKSIDMEEEVS
jgi:hypothetical protein